MKRLVLFLCLQALAWHALAQDINKVEYFIDTDPGYGAGVDVPIVAGPSIDEFNFQVELTGVDAGFHKLFIRSQDDAGSWSLVMHRTFVYLAETTFVAVDINKLEYFIDADPGYGNATDVPVSAGVSIDNFAFEVSLSSVSDGFHTLFVRSSDANGKWSIVHNRPFFKLAAISGALADIDLIEYFIDADPGYGSGTSVSFTPSQSIDDLIFDVDLTAVAEGPHTIFVRSRDANQNWSIVQVRAFDVCNQEVPVAAAASAVATTSLNANWTAIAGVTEYRLDVSSDNFSTFTPGYSDKSVTNAVIAVTGLVAGTDYQYRVRAVGANCTSINSNVVEVSTLPVPPVAPGAVAASNVEETSFTANWNAVSNATSYRLDVSSDNFVNLLVDYSDKEVFGTSSDIVGLTGGVTYKYRVRGVNIAGTSPNSNVISVTTLVLAPAAPVATAATNVAGRSFDAHWDAVYNADSYQLDVSADGFVTYVAGYENKSVTATNETVVGLERSTLYSFRVRAINVTATSANSNEIDVTTNSKDDQTITFTSLNAVTFGDGDFSLEASSTSGLAIDYSSSDQTVATVTGNTVTIVGAGTTTITAIQAGDSDYNAAVPVDQLLTVNKKGQTITFNGLAFKVVTDAAFDLEATSDSGLGVGYVSSDLSVAVISGQTVTIMGVGTTTITASQDGNANYDAANTVAQPLVVNKASQTITFNVLAGKFVNDGPFDLTATSSSLLQVTYTSSNPNVATVAGETVTIVGAGTSIITAKQAGDASYLSATDVQQSLVVSKLSQSITFGVLSGKTFGDGPFDLTATSSSLLPVTYTSSNPNVATVTGATVTIVGAGTTTITAKQAGDASYLNAADVAQSLVVSKRSQTITFGVLAAKTYGGGPFSLTATSDSQLPVTYSSSNVNVATIAGSTVTITGGGTVIITASQPGNNDYEAAIAKDQSLTINKANQTIVFNVLEDRTLGDAPFAAVAAASSNLEVTFSTNSDKVSIAANQVTMVKAGRAIVTASQTGDNNYNAATAVERSFCIKPAKPTIAISGINTESPTLTSSSPTGNQWFKDDAAIGGANGPTFSATAAGVYKVQVTIDDCVSEFSAGQSLIVTGTLAGRNNEITIYPNPVQDYLEVTGIEGDVVNAQLLDMTGRPSSLMLQRNGDTHRGDVQHLSPGVYSLRLETGSGPYQVKFIKR